MSDIAHVTPLVEQNIHKKGYEKAWKELLDEKRKTVQKHAKSSAVPLRSSSSICNRVCNHDVSNAMPQNIAQSPKAKSNPPTIAPLRSSSRIRNQVREVEGTKKKPSRRIETQSTTEAELNAPTNAPLKRSSLLRNKMQKVKFTGTKPSTRKNAQLMQKAKSNLPTIVPLRRSSRLLNQRKKVEAAKASRTLRNGKHSCLWDCEKSIKYSCIYILIDQK